MFRLGYSTNSLADHAWDAALELIAEAGYQSVAITVNHDCLNPFAPGSAQHIANVRRKLDQLKLASVVETGARYFLDPRRKHEPTLVSATAEERGRRVEFLQKCVETAGELGADALSFWSGIDPTALSPADSLNAVVAGVEALLPFAERHGVPLAFEPEPGMRIATMADFDSLLAQVSHPLFGLTLDLGHVHCIETASISDVIERYGGLLRNVHIEDMQRGIHEHLPFGEGTVDFPPVMSALTNSGYTGGVHVELARHSHVGPEMLVQSIAFLRGAMRQL